MSRPAENELGPERDLVRLCCGVWLEAGVSKSTNMRGMGGETVK